jgi:LPS export ABC transporter protein LptC
MITRRNSLWLIPILIIVTFPIWKIPIGSFLAPRGGYDPEIFKRKYDEHNFSMVNVNILQSEDGQKTTDIHAVKALTSKLPNEYILEIVTANVINKEGKVTNITADSGIYNTLTRSLKLVRNVVITNKEDKFTVTTDLLLYFDDKGKVHCPKKTQFKGDGIDIEGSSFDYDITRGFYEVGGRVKTTLKGYDAF